MTLTLLSLTLFLFQCKQHDVSTPKVIIVKSEQKNKTALPFKAEDPANNKTSLEKVKLGKLLFYDPILSGDKDIACATCHHPNNGYAEYRDLSIGTNAHGLGSKRVFNDGNTIPLMKRNSQTVLNTAFNGLDRFGNFNAEMAPMFWDSRVSSLENQALEPILALEEMRGLHYKEDEIINEVIDRLEKIPAYQALFKEAFQEEEENPINQINLGKAIASFERTLITPNSRFDQQMRGDMNAMSKSEKHGLQLFNQIGCMNCHEGPMFSDYTPHVIGVPHNKTLPEFDKGVNEDYAFRTPSLRNLRFTAPYMHNGQFNTLKEVLEFYEDLTFGKNMHSELQKEDLDLKIDALVLGVDDFGPLISFLNALNDEGFDKTIPETVPSGLQVAGNID